MNLYRLATNEPVAPGDALTHRGGAEAVYDSVMASPWGAHPGLIFVRRPDGRLARNLPGVFGCYLAAEPRTEPARPRIAGHAIVLSDDGPVIA